jgi:MoxR-like ATPase
MTAIRSYAGGLFSDLTTPILLEPLDLNKTRDPAGYIADEGLVDAVNVALMLQQPLLLTGEPGTGKTQLAFSLAWQLGLDPPLILETKSTSVSRDLFYNFDNLRRFQAAHVSGENLDPQAYISFKALGLAILYTLPAAEFAEMVPTEASYHEPHRSVVLIDEVDKAPRDFPNDILNEVEHLYFRVPEMGNKIIRADSTLRPIVIITSNSEKGLPDAFLRRCIYYNIPFPDEERLERIILTRVAGLAAQQDGALGSILEFFSRVRQDAAGLRKKPGTAELLNWTTALIGMGVNPSDRLDVQSERVLRTLCTLAKHPEDQTRVVGLFKAWAGRL